MKKKNTDSGIPNRQKISSMTKLIHYSRGGEKVWISEEEASTHLSIPPSIIRTVIQSEK